MTPATLKNLVHQKARTDENTFTDSEILTFANTYKDEIAGRIQDTRPGIWNIPAYFNLSAGDREYGFPSDILNRMTQLELKLSSTGDYQVATGLKEAPRGLSLENEEDIVSQYSGNPHYFIRRKAIFILSEGIVEVTNGGALTYNSFPADIENLTGTDDMSIDPSSTEHGFPREFHELLAMRISMAYKDANELPYSPEEQKYDFLLEKKLEEFSAPADESMVEIRETPDSNLLYGNGYDL